MNVADSRFDKYWEAIGLPSPNLDRKGWEQRLDSLTLASRESAVRLMTQLFPMYFDGGKSREMALASAPLLGKILKGELRTPSDADVKYLDAILPVVLPAEWQVLDQGIGQVSYRRDNGQTVIVSAHLAEGDTGARWVHFSTSHRARLPTWAELVEAKEIFLGTKTKAISVIPPRSEYVNINPNVLHLWVAVDGDGLPDFTLGSGSI